MGLHDYRHCGTVQLDVARSAAEGAQSRPPRCPVCGEAMTWIPAIGRMDQGAVKGAGFRAFETRDGQNRLVRVESLHALRKLERESEQAFRNGVGQPLVFRSWSNDPSNKDRSALHRSWEGGEQPSPEGRRKFRKTPSAAAPDATFGPGVHEGNCSSLGDP